MSSGAFSLDQLMELAGLSVSQAGIFSSRASSVFGSDSLQCSSYNPSARATASSSHVVPGTTAAMVLLRLAISSTMATSPPSTIQSKAKMTFTRCVLTLDWR